MTTPTPEPQAAATGMIASNRAVRRRRLAIAAIVVCLVGSAWWVYQRYTHIYSEDARIATDMIEVSAKLAGQITNLAVSQGDRLEPGVLIAQIDDRAAQLVLGELQAQHQTMLSTSRRLEAQIDMVDIESGGRLSASRSQLSAAEASLKSVASDLDFKRNEWERAQSLRTRQIISQQQWENARNAFHQSEQQHQRAQAEVASARANVTATEASLGQLKVLRNELDGSRHELERITMSIDRQKVIITDLRVTSSVGGIVDETFVHQGEYVVPGQRLLMMHDPANIWIDANIKETDIRHVVLGAPVAISVDAYPDRKFNGKVIRIGNAATSQFSLLPNTNPSGNFTKVTQRLPIRVSIEQSGELLRPGMMVEVAIEIR
ncbi:MAG TPA: HlyD family secretion protein [Pseudomonadales bacterium]|nr:HlyD family secretion protein [Pseudomonadales bacterium]HND13372.1 HlyD family secretion protein [Pseudomonadales bacterium]